MRVGKKKYSLSTCTKRWFSHNFSEYDPKGNRQCAFGFRGECHNKCLNRWHPIRCGECWRDSGLRLKRKLRED